MTHKFSRNRCLSVVFLFSAILMALATLPAASQAAAVRFAKAVGYPPGGSWYWTHVMVAVGDLNGDGHPDLPLPLGQRAPPGGDRAETGADRSLGRSAGIIRHKGRITVLAKPIALPNPVPALARFGYVGESHNRYGGD